MATTIGAVNVLLSLKSSAFSRQMRSAVVQVKSFQAQVTSTARSVAAFGASLTAIAGGAGLGVLVKRAFEAGDELAKLSDALGISAEDMAGLKLGADLAGSSIEELSQGIATLQRRLAEGANAGGRIDPNRLIKLPAVDQLKEVAEALKNIGTQAERMDVLQDLFGRGGRQLDAFLRGGSKGIEDAAREAVRLGTAFSRLDLSKIEQANDAFTTMRTAIGGLVQSFAIELAPAVKAIADSTTDWIVSAGSIRGTVTAAFEGVAAILATIEDSLTNIRVLVLKAERAFIPFAEMERSFFGGIKGVFTKTTAETSPLAAFRAGVAESVFANMDTATDRIAEINTELASLEGSGAVQALSTYFENIAKKIDEAAKNAKIMADNWRNGVFGPLQESPVVNQFETMGDAMEKLRNEFKAKPLKLQEPETMFGSIGFRQFNASPAAIRPGTIFGEQTLTLTRVSQQQLEQLKQINAGVKNIGQMN